MELRCVNCGVGVQRLLVQYSPGNIRLTKCENCRAVADPYVECEFMILLIDLILHKERAYRHLLFNLLNQDSIAREGILWKSSLIYFLADIYRTALLSGEWNSSKSSLFSVCICGKVLGEVFCGNLSFFGFLFLADRVFLDKPKSTLDISSFKRVFLTILLSSYFKIFLTSMMVWEFPSSAIYIVDVLALKQLPNASCIGVVLGAHGAKFLISACSAILSSSFCF
ncbi:unnamed protein product [Spirodela intermedia]|uniref:Protein ARV n=1 Tax=Spirodela intermedia TaxID=51605 RepID=A0A7I8IXH0_SPIIN|nr:unnamed protein product [Spirodela intermedia]CAA6662547.1 unnamed protein product [Spirodela intermedia]